MNVQALLSDLERAAANLTRPQPAPRQRADIVMAGWLADAIVKLLIGKKNG